MRLTRPKGRMSERDGRHVFDRVTRLAIYLRDDFKCCMCGTDLRHTLATGIRLIRWIPKKQGGTDGPENFLTACRPIIPEKVKGDRTRLRACNSIKHYRYIMNDRAYRYAMQEHLSKPLDLETAKGILTGRIKNKPNPYAHIYGEKLDKLRRKGELREGSTVTGNQNITKVTRLAIYIRDDFNCLYCGKRLVGLSPQEITLSCLTPYPKGLKVPTNLVTACKHCSTSKKNNDWSEKLEKRNKLEKIIKQLYTPIRRDIAKAVISGENNKWFNPWKKEVRAACENRV